MTASPGGAARGPESVAFRILGPLTVIGPNGPVRVPPGRQEVILAALLLEADRIVSTDYLVDLIWDDEPPDTARTQVQICVSRLRKLFSRADIAAAITTRPPGYVLRTEDEQVDALLFARRVAEARAAARQGDPGSAADLLRAADELWQGSCLNGMPSDTLRNKALQLDEERMTAAETRIDLELQLGRHHQLVAEIQTLVHAHPLRERLRGQLMLALYRSGRQAEALETYRVGRELLVEELGLEPGGELRGLEAAILAGDVPPAAAGDATRAAGAPAAAGPALAVPAPESVPGPRLTANVPVGRREPAGAGIPAVAGHSGPDATAPAGPGTAVALPADRALRTPEATALTGTQGSARPPHDAADSVRTLGPVLAGGPVGAVLDAPSPDGRDTRTTSTAHHVEAPPGRPALSATGVPSGEEVPRQLPADTSDFVGDEEQITGIERILLGDGTRRSVGLAVIVGKPGTGKSTLATHIGHRLGEHAYLDGQLYCDLRGTTGAPAASNEVLGRFLRALGIPGPVIPESQDERAEMYRTLLASRRILVVLDDAASESQVRPLLPGSSQCAVLVTSRMRLTGLPGAQRVELDVMGTERALELLARVIGPDRVERERAAAEMLIRTVGGLPLALRIVAARLAARPHWSLASMVQRLASERHRLDELTHGELTMRASLSLTHDGLAPEDRKLLRLLSLARAATLPGWLAGALLDDDRPYPSDLLEPLVDVQMLDVVGVESTGGFRYRFHEIIRVFAREQLLLHDEPPVQAAALDRMTGGWLSLAEQAHRRIYGGDFTVLHGTAPRWVPPANCVDELLANPLEWLDSEHAGLVDAVEQAAAAGMDELCWDLATTLATLFEGKGYFDDWLRTHQLALECVRAAGNTRGTAALLSSLGVLYLGRSQHEESLGVLTSALDLFQVLGDRQGLALCHRDLALLARMRGDDDRALTLYDRALRDFDQAGDVVGRAIVLTQSAHIWMRRQRIDTAQARLDEALAIYRSVGYTGGEARTLRRAGQLQQGQGAYAAAVRTFTEVLELCRDTGDVIGEGHLLRDLGHAHAEMGRGQEARGFYTQALTVREQIMDHGGAALVRLDLARLLAASGDAADRARSRELLETATGAFRERRMGPELAEAQRLLDAAGAGPAGGLAVGGAAAG
ncbi:BTAD domain-containing putative transcriptional regulator [Streptomyces sp. DH24]|uniref:AfsR/SARP family transcriptional regulator n=1 Tax=Streptomyces sp. DH24 TaxID=3040123 RepID=UPI002441F495|nr:BTAD domain-containing putative transcriptional regulator [Streptomyces sp. DH24]MDG9718416.1 BTAD domain-containing putative transcriptional regulator [Streptomyces sp. DH24]